MGLERLACIMQGVDNLFLVDTVQNIMKKISSLVNVNYGDSEKTDISLRVITDHIRSVSFMIGDGVMPSNEGRGYVLRRLLRRAARHGRLLGVKEPFLYKVVDTVIAENPAYPELSEKREIITKVIKTEEESFGRTLDQGFAMLNEIIEKSEINRISGEDAFRLNDTFGFPVDLIKEIAEEKGMSVDIAGYDKLLAEQKKRAKEARKKSDTEAWLSDAVDFSGIEKTEFVGYTDMTSDSKILAIVKDGEKVQFGGTGEEVVIVLDKTPFYAESGGQIGDTGTIKTKDAVIFVVDTVKDNNGIFMHRCRIDSGTVETGDEVQAVVNRVSRLAIMRNHTAAHLLQAALREVLGNHVEQAGQLVTDEKLRFDFTHFSALTAEEIKKVEYIVNKEIAKAYPVETKEMPIEEAKKLGAMALFGEKYGDVVRVVMAGDFSREFCGGTHMDNTAKLGLFRIVSENSVAAGVRRIEAVTGWGIIELLDSYDKTIGDTMKALKTNSMTKLTSSAEKLMEELKAKEKEIEALTAKLSSQGVDTMLSSAEAVGNVRVACGRFNGMNAGTLKTMADTVMDKAPDCVAVMFAVDGEKANLCVACGKEAVRNGAHAGKIIKDIAALVGGKGGGKPERAMAGVGDISLIGEALSKAKDIIASKL